MAQVQELFDDFLTEIVINGKSFFNNQMYIRASLSYTSHCFIDNYDDNKEYNFEEKMEKQFKSAGDHAKEIFFNLLYLRYLPIADLKMEAKCKKLISLRNSLGLTPIDEKIREKVPKETIGIYSQAMMRIYDELSWLIELFGKLFDANSQNKLDLTNIKSLIINLIEKDFIELQKNNKASLPIQNTLLYLCDRTKYDSTATYSYKKKILGNLWDKYFEIDKCNSDKFKLSEIDDNLLKLKKAICDNKNYAHQWDNNNKTLAIDVEKVDGCSLFWLPEIKAKWIGDVADAREILEKYQKQIIFYGAPGTGKTYAAEELINKIIRYNGCEKEDKDLDEERKRCHYNDTYENDPEDYKLDEKLQDKNVIWEIVQFNQSYSYEDFIEGMRPVENGALKPVDGIFKRFCNVAKRKENKEKAFIFVIDEINRGKIDKIFGELLYLLEYRGEELRLHYSSDEFSIPQNVYIVGTMNTADKSIALLDVALRRRFWFVRCNPKRYVIEEEFFSEGEPSKMPTDKAEKTKWFALKLFDWLNGKGNEAGQLTNILGNDADELKIGHSYFLKLIRKDDYGNVIDPTFDDLRNIWFYSIVPLLEEYCGFDRKRLSEMLTLKGEDLSKVEKFNEDILTKKLK